MKLFCPLILFLAISINAQIYVDIENLNSKFAIKKYTLNTKDIYSLDKQIEIYNVFVGKSNILLFSVFPNLESTKNTWSEIEHFKIKDSLISSEKFPGIVSEWLEDNTPDKKTFKYTLVKKENNKYYASDLCLTELFTISPLVLPMISKYGSINILENEVSILDMMKSFQRQIPGEEFIMDLSSHRVKILDHSYQIRNYRSKDYLINNERAYQFWTFDGWWMQDGYNEHRGIDRFLYIPGKGIIGGSYDFYFNHKPKISSDSYFRESKNKLWDNIINEKIMIAEDLKKTKKPFQN